MALQDFAILTQSSFESGVSASKWVTLCQLLRSKQPPEERSNAVGGVISNSVLGLFASYPADPTLIEYLRSAIQAELLPLSTYIATFLQAIKSTDLQTPATIEMLCRIALDSHYSSGKPGLGSIIAFGEPGAAVPERLRDGFSLLQIACSLPAPHFHRVTQAASELVALLLSCIDVTKINLNDSMLFYSQVSAVAGLPLPPLLIQQLGRFDIALNLNIMDKSDDKTMLGGPLTHDLGMSLGPGIVPESLPDTDVITCSALLQHLMINLGTRLGPGNTAYSTATLSGLYRWTSWSLATFYRQLLVSGFSSLAQIMAHSEVHGRRVRLWWFFLIGRLPMLLQGVDYGEAGADQDWRSAFQEALLSAIQNHNFINICNQGAGATQNHNFRTLFLTRLASSGCIDAHLVATLDPLFATQEASRIARDAAAAGVSLQSFIENKISVMESSYEDLEDFVTRNILDDYDAHAPFSQAIVMRIHVLINSIQEEVDTHSNMAFGGTDAEHLGCLLRLLYQHDLAIDIIATHVDLQPVLNIMTIWERCDLDSDPQTSVNHLGHLVLFMQSTIARYKLSVATHNTQIRPTPGVYLTAVSIMKPESIPEEDVVAYTTWRTALFALNSDEGIGDSSFSAARPICFLRIAPTLVSNAVSEVIRGSITVDVLREGLSYFCGPLFNWTLVGVIKALLAEFQRTGFRSAVHFEVLETFIMSKSTPTPVLQLCSPAILRFFSERATQHAQSKGQIDLIPLRKRALHALGLSKIIDDNHVPPNFDGPKVQFTSTGRTTIDLAPAVHWAEQPARHLRDALTAVQEGRAPLIDIAYCLRIAPPTQFVHTLVDELLQAASMGTPMANCRTLATLVLVMPDATGALPPGRTLLPVFLHAVVPRLLVLFDEPTALVADPTLRIELLVAIVPSALTAALHLERAYGAMVNANPAPQEQAVPVSGHPAAAMARRLLDHLRQVAATSHSASMLLQRLVAIPAFTANFPMFVK